MDDYEYMIKEERKNRILELAESHEIISIDDIAQALEVSKATVRRDIDELDAEGSVEKTRGGIMSVNHKLRIEPSPAHAQQHECGRESPDGRGRAQIYRR